ncbi:MAG: phosphonate ABC transporter ATP-binding protein [Elainellaceae cyanobacterium]
MSLSRSASAQSHAKSIMVPALELSHVSHRFGKFEALSDISLRIEAGERVALVGSSGAGKSTLLRLMNGTLMPTSGRIWLMGQCSDRLSSKRLRRVQQQIGTIYQQFHLVNSLRVVHNVNAGHLGRWPFWKAAASLLYPLEVETAARALAQVGIPDKLYARTDQLSGGQQQRVALARVLIQNPALILADEPIASLDPELSRSIMDLLRDLTTELGKTLVVSLHSVDFARSHCDRLIGLRQGRILFDAPADQVSPDMLHALYQHDVSAMTQS